MNPMDPVNPENFFDNRRAHSSPSAVKLILSVILSAIGVILLIVGVVFTLVGNYDYSDHTGRAEAVVVERHVERQRDDDGRTRTKVQVYVAYEANGQSVERAYLGGLNPSNYVEGQRIEVAYRPDSPESPVTMQSLEEGAFDIFRYIGIAAVVISISCLCGAVVLFLRGRS